MPDNTIDWGQGSANNDIGWGKGPINNDLSWGMIGEDSYGHDETNLMGGGGATAPILSINETTITIEAAATAFKPSLSVVETTITINV